MIFMRDVVAYSGTGIVQYEIFLLIFEGWIGMDSLLIIKLIRYLGLKVFLVLNNSYNLEI